MLKYLEFRVVSELFPEVSYFFGAVSWVSYDFHLLLVVGWELLFDACAADAFI